MASARAALRREIVAVEGARPGRSRLSSSGQDGRRWLMLVAAVGAVAAVGLLVLVVSSRRDPFGVKVVAAAGAALNPTRSEIIHSISRSVVVFHSKTRTTRSVSADEVWSTGRPSPVTVDHFRYGSDGHPSSTLLTTACGNILYDGGANLFTVSPFAQLFDVTTDPVAVARTALPSGRVHYRGPVSFNGVAASKLVVTQYGAVTTYIVRRDNGYPLKTISRRVTATVVRTQTTTYSLFEHLPRTQRTTQRLRMAPHAGAFFVRMPGRSGAPNCTGFGNLDSLTRRSHQP